MELNTNMEEINESGLELIDGGVSYTKLIGGAVGLTIVAPICGVVGGTVGYGAAFAGSTQLLFSGID